MTQNTLGDTRADKINSCYSVYINLCYKNVTIYAKVWQLQYKGQGVQKCIMAFRWDEMVYKLVYGIAAERKVGLGVRFIYILNSQGRPVQRVTVSKHNL